MADTVGPAESISGHTMTMAEATTTGETGPPNKPVVDDEPVLPDVTSDERGSGWGDEPSRRDDDWYLSERPPHHG